MNLKRGDRVKITNKDDIEGEVIGFYAHTMDAVIKTDTGNEWIVSPIHLEPTDPPEKKWWQKKTK
jgi:hypothetical protein